MHLLLNLVTVGVFIARGQGKVILRAKLDAVKGLPKMWVKRKQIQAARVATVREIWRVLDKRLLPRKNNQGRIVACEVLTVSALAREYILDPLKIKELVSVEDPKIPLSDQKIVDLLKKDGIQKVLTYVTSGFSSYSGCRQYRENIAAALEHPDAAGMQIDKLRVFYNHPDFIAVLSEQVTRALSEFAPEERHAVHVAFTAHSIPTSMAGSSDYTQQLRESCRLVAGSLGLSETQWSLVYQSRSGRPEDPWLEPDICDFLATLKAAGTDNVVISPIGFLSDHMEVLYDLDDEARRVCIKHELRMVRAGTPGSHPQFIRMIRKLIEERLHGAPRECLGQFGANHDVCPAECCPASTRSR